MRLVIWILLLVPVICSAQPLSFKGLTLGMTKNQVEDLLRSSRWIEVFGVERDTLGWGESTFLAADGYGMHLTRDLLRDSLIVRSKQRASDTFSSWACEARVCYGFDKAHVVFSGSSDTSRLNAVTIISPPFDTSQSVGVKRYVRAVFATLVGLYGEPYVVDKLFAPINAQTMDSFLSGSEWNVASWIWLPGERGGGLPGSAIIVMIRQTSLEPFVEVTVSMSAKL